MALASKFINFKGKSIKLQKLPKQNFGSIVVKLSCSESFSFFLEIKESWGYAYLRCKTFWVQFQFSILEPSLCTLQITRAEMLDTWFDRNDQTVSLFDLFSRTMSDFDFLSPTMSVFGFVRLYRTMFHFVRLYRTLFDFIGYCLTSFDLIGNFTGN